MRHLPKSFSLMFILGALACFAGCRSKVDFEKTESLTFGEVKSFEIDGPKTQQKVSIAVTADNPVNVHVVAAADHAATKGLLLAEKKPEAAKLLGSKEKAQSDTIEVTVPANTAFVVFLSGAGKKTEAKVKITSK